MQVRLVADSALPIGKHAPEWVSEAAQRLSFVIVRDKLTDRWLVSVVETRLVVEGLEDLEEPAPDRGSRFAKPPGGKLLDVRDDLTSPLRELHAVAHARSMSVACASVAK